MKTSFTKKKILIITIAIIVIILAITLPLVLLKKNESSTNEPITTLAPYIPQKVSKVINIAPQKGAFNDTYTKEILSFYPLRDDPNIIDNSKNIQVTIPSIIFTVKFTFSTEFRHMYGYQMIIFQDNKIYDTYTFSSDLNNNKSAAEIPPPIETITEEKIIKLYINKTYSMNKSTNIILLLNGTQTPDFTFEIDTEKSFNIEYMI